jgi:hypothetical protein
LSVVSDGDRRNDADFTAWASRAIRGVMGCPATLDPPYGPAAAGKFQIPKKRRQKAD